MQPFFIASSGTNVGKTHVMATLCWQLREAQKRVTALKPVITGYDHTDVDNDAAVILRSSGLTPTPSLMESITMWRYKAPLAPNMSAAVDAALPVNLDALIHYCRSHEKLSSDLLLVEGVGGVMVPLNDRNTTLDWMQALNWPVILVVGSYLGTISHTLTALEVLDKRKLVVKALVVNQSPKIDVPLEATVATFEQFISRDIPIVKLPRSDKPEPWKHMPRITWMVDV